MSGDHLKVMKDISMQYVKLNVGGTLHYSTVGTLTKQSSMLCDMFSGRIELHTDSEGWILIDRCGKHFAAILNFLRDNSVSMPHSQQELQELLAEARHYCINELVEECENSLRQREAEKDTMCSVALITSYRGEQLLIQSTSRPVIKLLFNRQNNKYSYTSNSDDNLLKNIELFDKLSLRLRRKVLFIKDVIGSNEICLWSFYRHGRVISEISCISIIYATDRKHTKVEYPESRIKDEVMSVLLCDQCNGPDVDPV